MQMDNNYELDVFNGDLGFIVKLNVAEKKLTVQYPPRPVTPPLLACSYVKEPLTQSPLAPCTTKPSFNPACCLWFATALWPCSI
jgi:hypothetical protein